ncbi:hypothetical protein ACI6Q2_19115 [Chitinophagaceae bacterium LWZ2-11]
MKEFEDRIDGLMVALFNGYNTSEIEKDKSSFIGRSYISLEKRGIENAFLS